MNENAKTLTFVALAVVVVGVWATHPTLQVAAPEIVNGQLLFPNLTDPLAVTNMEIVKFDEETGTVQPFDVAQIDVKGKLVWRIPSHDDYPADAKDQVAAAAAGLMGLKSLGIVSSNQGDQKEFGVVDPNPKTLKLGDTGVGVKVVMKNKEGKDLLALIIGKPVPDKTDLRYVRIVGQDPIYIVKVSSEKLSTKFDDWIERNLLSINTFDMKQLWIQDYSVDKFQGALLQNGEMVIGYNDTGEPKWTMLEDRKLVPDRSSPTGGKFVAVKMAADDELNTAKLDEMKTALDDLKIVDVSRKPAALSADLKAATDFMSKPESAASLDRYGFTVADVGGQMGLYSNNGEVRVLMKDGVQYVLRFGGIAGEGAATKDKDKEKDGKGPDGKKEDKKADGPNLNRYLFVMAEFDPNVIPKPQLEPLPEPKKDAKAEEKKADAPKTDAKPGEEKKDEKPAAGADAERERIEKENKRKQDEYAQKIADGKKKVSELNARFADWYYVIANDVYRKIHLSRDQVVKKKEAPKPDAKAGAQPPVNPLMPDLPQLDMGQPAAPVAQPAAAKPAETKPAAAKPADTKPAETKPAAAKPAEAKPADAKPATEKKADEKKADAKPAAPTPSAAPNPPATK